MYASMVSVAVDLPRQSTGKLMSIPFRACLDRSSEKNRKYCLIEIPIEVSLTPNSARYVQLLPRSRQLRSTRQDRKGVGNRRVVCLVSLATGCMRGSGTKLYSHEASFI